MIQSIPIGLTIFFLSLATVATRASVDFTADADNDGLTYRQEQLIGTNPFPVYDVFHIIDLGHATVWAQPDAIADDGGVSGTLSEVLYDHTIGFRWNPNSGFSAFYVKDSTASVETDASKISYNLDGITVAAVNGSGQAVGTDGENAVYAYDGQTLNLNDLLAEPSDWQFTAATDINEAGQITGYATLDGQNYGFLLTPASNDFDGDGLPDDWELYYGLDPTATDSDGDGIADSAEDLNGDGIPTLAELQSGQSPLYADPYENLNVERIFVDGLKGRDSNDGLSIISPKATITNSAELADVLMSHDADTMILEVEEGAYNVKKLGSGEGTLIIRPKGKVIIKSN